MFILGFAVVRAEDLSNYPNFLIKNNQLNITLVVGDQSSAINVLAQSNIAASLAGLSAKFSISNKLSSELLDLEQNLILIGNPCINPITAHVMGNPEPCDKGFSNGKALIRLYDENGFSYIVVAGYSDLGTRKAAEVLANFNNYKFIGEEYVVYVDEDTAANQNTDTIPSPEKNLKSKEDKIVAQENSQDTSQEEAKQEVQKSLEEKLKRNSENASSNIRTETADYKDEQIEPQEEIDKNSNIISRFISWFMSLFR